MPPWRRYSASAGRVDARASTSKPSCGRRRRSASTVSRWRGATPPAMPRIVKRSRPSGRARRPSRRRRTRAAARPCPTRLRAVDALVALGDDGADAEQQRALGRPVARRAGAVLLAGEHDERHALGRDSARRRRRSSAARRTAGAPCSRPRLPSASALRRRMLPNVPRTITSWLPRRAPNVLKSRGSTPCSAGSGRRACRAGSRRRARCGRS